MRSEGTRRNLVGAKPRPSGPEMLSKDALDLLKELAISIKCEDVHIGKHDKPAPLSALAELIQHHPELQAEVKSLRDYEAANKGFRTVFGED